MTGVRAVAGALGRKYWGCDLRAEQVAANERQAQDINQRRPQRCRRGLTGIVDGWG